MNSRQDLEVELKSVADRIGTARDALARDEIVEVSDIPERMRTVANAITDLPPEDAIELRPALADLLTDFKGFAEELKVKIGEIEAAGGAAARQSGG
jgi:hypothetical protein